MSVEKSGKKIAFRAKAQKAILNFHKKTIAKDYRVVEYK